MPHTKAKAGDSFICVGPAGGGYGDPLERDMRQVLEDVRDGLISIDTARNDYGVVITDVLQLDEAATANCRSSAT
jgi:N-methylhydantoinase B